MGIRSCATQGSNNDCVISQMSCGRNFNDCPGFLGRGHCKATLVLEQVLQGGTSHPVPRKKIMEGIQRTGLAVATQGDLPACVDQVSSGRTPARNLVGAVRRLPVASVVRISFGAFRVIPRAQGPNRIPGTSSTRAQLEERPT